MCALETPKRSMWISALYLLLASSWLGGGEGGGGEGDGVGGEGGGGTSSGGSSGSPAVREAT